MQDTFCLRVNDLHIRQGELVVVVGRTASGKSALVNALLNEMDLINQGTVSVRGRICYVPQVFSLRNNTIRSNVIYSSDRKALQAADEAYLRRVYASCDLLPDLSIFEEGDRYSIGSNGGNLSGGQKQRVCIGRAFYAMRQSDIIIMDDIFSSVDPQVADVIWSRGVMDLLRDKTRIIVLNDFRYIDSTADQVLLLSKGQLVQNSIEVKYYLGFDHTERNPLQSDRVSPDGQTQQATELSPHRDETKLSERPGTGEGDTEILLGTKQPRLRVKPGERGVREKRVGAEHSASSPGEGLSREGGDQIRFGDIKLYLGEMGYISCSLIIVSMFLMQGTQNYYDLWLKKQFSGSTITDRHFLRDIVIISGANLLTTLFRSFIFAYGNLRASRNIFAKLQKRVLESKVAFFDQTDTSLIISRFAGDTVAIDNNISFNANILLKMLFQILGSFTIIIL